MLFTRTKGALTGLTLGVLLTACAGATLIGAGCQTYGEARKGMPVEAIATAEPALALWIDSLDFAMTKACFPR